MAVCLVVVLFTGVLYSCPFHWCVTQVDVTYFPQSYPLQKALKSALITEETLCTMRQVFVPVIVSHAQEVQQDLVYIDICVEITVDQTVNSPLNINASCMSCCLLLFSQLLLMTNTMHRHQNINFEGTISDTIINTCE